MLADEPSPRDNRTLERGRPDGAAGDDLRPAPARHTSGRRHEPIRPGGALGHPEGQAVAVRERARRALDPDTRAPRAGPRGYPGLAPRRGARRANALSDMLQTLGGADAPAPNPTGGLPKANDIAAAVMAFLGAAAGGA